MSITLNRCPLCSKHVSGTKEGRVMHMRQYHHVTDDMGLPRLDFTDALARY